MTYITLRFYKCIGTWKSIYLLPVAQLQAESADLLVAIKAIIRCCQNFPHSFFFKTDNSFSCFNHAFKHNLDLHFNKY